MAVSLVGLLFVIGCVSASKTNLLYSALNVTCLEQTELERACQSGRTTPGICASGKVIDALGDQCAALYQFTEETFACDSTSRALRDLRSTWWDDAPAIFPGQVVKFLSAIRFALVEKYSVKFSDNEKCFSATDLLQDHEASQHSCILPSSQIEGLCASIIQRLTDGWAICSDNSDASLSVRCKNGLDADELFHHFANEDGQLNFQQFHSMWQYLSGSKDGRVSQTRLVREAEDEDDHGHEDDHDHEASTTTCLNETELREEFNHVAEEFALIGPDGADCAIEETASGNETANNCTLIYDVCRDLILEAGLATEDCPKPTNVNSRRSRNESAAYGWGFLSTVIISIASQLGLVLILAAFSKRAVEITRYILSALIAMGVSVLVCDAILHLIPEAFAEEEEEEEDGHGHGHAHSRTTIWRGCCVLSGILLFYLFENILGLIKRRTTPAPDRLKNDSAIELPPLSYKNKDVSDDDSDSQLANCCNVQIGAANFVDNPPYYNANQGFCHGISSIAWMIILGDSLHNFADGLAIGAAFTVSNGIGISTSLTVLFHEIPHEFGDFAILLSSGMKWYIALFYNFLSAIVAILGMFIGVAVSHANEDATGWILAITAGIFLYIGLVDLLPALQEVLNRCNDAKKFCVYLALHLTGFAIGFVILLLIAIYEEDLETLVD